MQSYLYKKNLDLKKMQLIVLDYNLKKNMKKIKKLKKHTK